MLAVIPEFLIQKWGTMNEAERLEGVFVEIKKDFNIVANGGNFKFDVYSVKTN